MYIYWFFQTGMLINFFIPLRWAEAIARENFVVAKQDSSSTKEGETFYI